MVFTITLGRVDVSSFIFRVINFDYKSNWPGFFSLLYLWPFFQKKTIKFWNSFQHKKIFSLQTKEYLAILIGWKMLWAAIQRKWYEKHRSLIKIIFFIRDWKNLVHECRIHVKLHICIYIYLHINLFFVDIHIYTDRFLELNFALQNTSKMYILKLQRQYF